MRHLIRVLLVLLPLAFCTTAGHAQILKKLKEKAGEKIEKAIENPPEKEAKTEERQKSQGEQEPVAAAKTSGMPGEGAWANFDFVPGERILYYDDFTKDEVGDFPRRMEFKNGAWEIVEWQGQRWLRGTNYNSAYYIVLPEVLPARFTMEFDYANPSGTCTLNFVEGQERNVHVEYSGGGGVRLYNWDAQLDARGEYAPDGDWQQVRKGRLLADGKYVKMYLDDKRILNVPNGDIGRSNKIRVDCEANVDKPVMFANFRIAAGGRKLYDALSAEGRVATQGILFDTNSDRIRPESTPTLKEIGTMLTEHPELSLLIEGHTDNVGDDAANLALSDKRAAAVKAYLVAKHSVAASRLQTKGLGESKPATTNDTVEGRQQNRRVELVKL